VTDPHSLILPDAAQIIAAFQKDLLHTLSLMGSVEGADTTVAFTFASSAQPLAFIPDRDYNLVGECGSTGIMISTNSTLTFGNSSVLLGPRSDIIFQTTGTSVVGLKIPLKSGVKYWVVSNGGGGCVLTLQPA